ncbi:AMP-binding protein [Tenggerimyces flavus]|uniref:AMP-binding protein n=1 Tax=Tenggerimyces flavus TaxID=1708749 RepID=A0ABV7YCL9_9ACTN|nr:AMP-binding protein [Tenggerimyces flavus]MBM7783408.1 acyl-CoA synthetase (AMP-forming)/AMP-acid ligase II [Tenggerimyces flavus]
MIRAEAVADVAVGLTRLLRAVRPWRPSVARTIRRYGLTLGALVEVAALRRPAAVALVDDRGAVTNAELLSAADELTDRLAGKGNRLGVLAANTRDFVITVAAAARVGADVTLFSPALPPAELEALIEEERLDLVLPGDAPASRAIPSGRGRRRGRLVVLTSGTTGPPKGAHRTFRLLQAIPISTLVHRIPMPAGESMLLTPPLNRGFGLGFLALGLTFGVTVLLGQTTDDQARLLTEREPALVVGVPPVLAKLADAVGRQRVRAVVSGAMPLDPEVAASLGESFGPVFNLYGATEQGWSTLATPADLAAAPGTVGRPAAGVRLHVLDAEHRPVAPGVRGQLWVRSTLAFSRYSNGSDRPRLGRLIASGDRAHRDAQGRYFIHDRLG